MRRVGRRARAGRAAVGVGAARAAAAGAAAAAALALLLQVVRGARDERAGRRRLDALARGVRVLRLAGEHRAAAACRHAPSSISNTFPLLPANLTFPARRRPKFPMMRLRPDARTNFVLLLRLHRRPRDLANGRFRAYRVHLY